MLQRAVRSSLFVLCAASASVFALAQSGRDPVPAPPGQSPSAEKTRPADGAAPRASASLVQITLAAPTPEQMDKSVAALQAIVHPLPPSWVCPSCNAKSRAKGQCTKCVKELVQGPTEAKAFSEVRGDGAKGTIALAIAPEQSVALAEIESAVQKADVQLERSEIAVPAFVRLMITAPPDAKDAENAIKSALTGSALVTSASLRFDEKRKQYAVIVEGVSGTPTFGAIGQAIEKVGPGYELLDMAWTSPCESCAKSGKTAASCKSCWRDPKADLAHPRG